MQFKILGPTKLVVADEFVDLGPAKQRALLALLLYNVNDTVSVASIGRNLWPGRSIEDVQHALWAQVSRVRKVLKDCQVSAELLRVDNSYRLNADPELIDYHLFVRRLQTARAAAAKGDHEAVVITLSDAVEWWEGVPLEGLKSADAEHTRELMINMWGLLPAYHLLFDSLLALGQHDTVLSRLDPLLDKYRDDEELAKQWMLALGATGGSPDHLARQYDRLRLRLDDTGGEPLEELRNAYRRALGSRPDPQPDDYVPPRQLLRDVRDFTGHDDLLAVLDAMVDEPGAPASIALTGMGGIGKTTLAVHWAHRRRDVFPDGQIFVDGHGFGSAQPTSSDDVVARCLHALGVAVDRIPTAGERRRAKLANLLADRRVLIILDNFRNAEHVRPLLPALSPSLVLITSRDRLKGLTIRDGVRSIAMATLSTAESIALLTTLIGVDRAETAPSAVDKLADLCGGLPLALRIAGLHVADRPHVPLDVLAEELRILLSRVEDDLDVDDEEATLHTVFWWSYQELPASTARMFRLLGLHPGSTFSAAAATALYGSKADRHLAALIRLHLIEHDAEQRFRIHDLTHLYALGRCELDDSPSDRSAAVRRMLDFFLLTATNAALVLFPQSPPVPGLPKRADVVPLTFESRHQALRWFAEGNVLAAVKYAAAQGYLDHSWQIAGTSLDYFLHFARTLNRDLVEVHEVALRAARVSAHPEGLFGTLSNLGILCVRQGEHQRAAELLQEALGIARKTGHRAIQAVLLHNLAWAMQGLGELRQSIDLYEQAAAINLEYGNDANRGHNLHRMGTAYAALDRSSQAMEKYVEALDVRERVGDRQGQAQTHAELALLAFERGDLDQAINHSSAALHIHREIPDLPVMALALTISASVHLHQNRLKDAIVQATRSARIAAEIHDFALRVRALDVLGSALQADGDYSAARAALLEELSLLDSHGDPRAARTRERLAGLDNAKTAPAQQRRRTMTSTPLDHAE